MVRIALGEPFGPFHGRGFDPHLRYGLVRDLSGLCIRAIANDILGFTAQMGLNFGMRAKLHPVCEMHTGSKRTFGGQEEVWGSQEPTQAPNFVQRAFPTQCVSQVVSAVCQHWNAFGAGCSKRGECQILISRNEDRGLVSQCAFRCAARIR